MRQDSKNKELQERQAYVPASVKVIETSMQRVICASGDGTETPGLTPDTDPYSF